MGAIGHISREDIKKEVEAVKRLCTGGIEA
jgi:hypothetical protein